MPTRSATATWTGGLKTGSGNFAGAAGLGGKYTFASRFEEAAGLNPEDLLALATFKVKGAVVSAQFPSGPRGTRTITHPHRHNPDGSHVH